MMKFNKIQLILGIGMLFSSLLLSTSFSPLEVSSQKTPSWIHGEWGGMGYQIDGAVWEVSLTCNEKGELAINYPTLGCGGEWKIKKATKNRLDLEETIISGVENCDQHVQIVVFRIDKANISVTYFLPSYGEGPIAYTVLERKE